MPQITPDTRGVFVITATPFTPDGALDLASIDRMIDFYREAGADGVTILGVMGEAPKLTPEESLQVIRTTLARAGDMPVIVGASAPGLAAIRDLGRRAMDLGAAGVMVAPTGGLRSNESIIDYYAHVVEALGPDVPLCLQDFPMVTGVTISPATLGAIFESHPSVVMLKHEDWPGLAKITALRGAEASGRRRVSILCGNGGLFLPEELRRGADGAMTGFAYPEMMVDVCRLNAIGDHARAQDIFDAYLPLVRYEQQQGVGLAARKYTLARRGIIASDTQRKPGGALPPQAVAELEFLIQRQERRLAELG